MDDGMERNSGLVVMASYAPLFVNVNPGGMQWESDLIGYDALTRDGSPSFYAQGMLENIWERTCRHRQLRPVEGLGFSIRLRATQARVRCV